MARILFFHAISPIHVGIGQSVGAVDLPLAREKTTGFPYIPGTSIKGVLRDIARKRSDFPVEKVFGPESDGNASDHAGALSVGDARLLLLPVRSLVGTFAWVTCPFLLQRFARDATAAGLGAVPRVNVSSISEAVVSPSRVIQTGQRVFFEDLDFKESTNEAVSTLATWLGDKLFAGQDADQWKEMLKKRLCVLHDDAFAFFAYHGTEIVTRIAMDRDKKTVKSGALWTEESLPTESIMASLLDGQDIRFKHGRDEWTITTDEALDYMKDLIKAPIQIGGDATVGRGRCMLRLVGKNGGAQ